MFCNRCGKELPDDSRFCLECGQSLPVNVRAAPPQPQPSKGRRTIVLFGRFHLRSDRVWLLITVIAIVMVVWLTTRSGSTPTDRGTSAASNEGTRTLTGNPANDRLLALPQDQQAQFLGIAANNGCVGTRAFYMGIQAASGKAFWSVSCTNGQEYAIEIDADAGGSTKVLDCSLLTAIAHVNCFEKFAGQR